MQIVGEIERRQHYHLNAQHVCYFFGEYTPHEYTEGRRASFSETNQHISNLKKSMTRKGMHDWHYKANAIDIAGKRLFDAINWETAVKDATFIPVPPSKIRTDAAYDDRMLKVLQRLNSRLPFELDIRDMLISDGSLNASHENNGRATPEEISKSISFDEALAGKLPAPKYLFVLDDVLTTGSHFVGISQLLSQRFPGVPIVGCFVARTVRPETDFSAIFDDSPDIDF